MPASASLSDRQLPALLDQFDARQVLHVTFGSVLETYGETVLEFLPGNEERYENALVAHFERHLTPFR